MLPLSLYYLLNKRFCASDRYNRYHVANYKTKIQEVEGYVQKRANHSKKAVDTKSDLFLFDKFRVFLRDVI